MSAPTVENPIKESVSISCTCCVFQDFGPLPRIEPVAARHARELGHPVRLSIGFLPAGFWMEDGKFVSMRGNQPPRRGSCSATL